jgi:hypothetical protein
MALRIIPLFANEDHGIYGDIFNTAEEVLEAHPGATVLKGFGILDTETGYIADDTEDFYATEAEAQLHMENL